jgi:polar amino acid transport system ATP-binding protein
MALVEVKDLKKSFGSLQVLKGISLNIERGEIVVLVGPSGSGKSTFLRCLNMLENSSSGEIKIAGIRLCNDRKVARQIYLNVGMVFQHFNLFNHMTVMKNMTYAPMHVKNMSKEEAEKKGTELLERVGLLDKKDTYPGMLSGGQKQRVAIARALAMEPSIMLFDEPTSALDPEMVTEVLNVIRELQDTGITMIFVTHEMGFAKEIASRMLFMDAGYIVEDKDTKSFFENPETERAKDFLKKIL